MKENQLPDNSTMARVKAFRTLSTDTESKSEFTDKEDISFPISQITGLVAALAGKVSTPVIKSQLGFIKADGSINGSGMEIKNITDIASMDLAFSGEYTAITPFTYNAIIGQVYSVTAHDNSAIGEANVTPIVRTTAWQLIKGSRGLFLRNYSLGSWSDVIYLGGSSFNYMATWAELTTMASGGKLTPGVLYRLTDHGNDNGIILEAATSTTFYSEAIRIGIVPQHYTAGVYDGATWLGVWRPTLSPNAGEKVVFMGRVWNKLTGTDGNAGTIDDSDPWRLDSVHWGYSEPIQMEDNDYKSEVFGCIYDFATDYISKQWDDKGNIFGEYINPTDGFLVEYNDWNFAADGATFSGNKTRRCYNNFCDADYLPIIKDNTGQGDIKNNIAFPYIIVGNIFEYDGNNTPVIQIVGAAGSAYRNRIGGSITDDIVQLSDCEIYGHLTSNTDVEMFRTRIDSDCTLSNKNFNGYNISDSIIKITYDTVETYASNKVIRDDVTPFKATTGETFRLETPVYDDINVAIASGTQPASNAPTWTAFTANTNSYTFAIDDYKDMATIEIPHSYKEGTNLEVHLHLATNGLNNATARKVKYTVFFTYGIPDNGANVFTVESSLTAELTIPANQADKSVYYLSLGTITGTSIKIGTQLKMRIKRIAGTGTEPINNPFLEQVGVHFQVDTIGSRTISAK